MEKYFYWGILECSMQAPSYINVKYHNLAFSTTAKQCGLSRSINKVVSDYAAAGNIPNLTIKAGCDQI